MIIWTKLSVGIRYRIKNFCDGGLFLAIIIVLQIWSDYVRCIKHKKLL